MRFVLWQKFGSELACVGTPEPVTEISTEQTYTTQRGDAESDGDDSSIQHVNMALAIRFLRNRPTTSRGTSQGTSRGRLYGTGLILQTKYR